MSNSAHHHWESGQRAAEQDASADDVFEVLRKERRRTVLSVLRNRDSPTDVGALARAVADARTGDPGDETVEEVHVALHHVDLPKLDAVDLVDHDRDADKVGLPGDDFAGVPIDIE